MCKNLHKCFLCLITVVLFISNKRCSFSPADQEAPRQPHQAPNERLHGLVPDGEAGDCQARARHAQRRCLFIYLKDLCYPNQGVPKQL